MNNSANVWVPILVAIVTGLVTVITVFLTGRANQKLEREKFESSAKLEQQKFDTSSKLERQKFESSLVLQAIATGQKDTAQTNLEFLVNVGFLHDPEGRIKELAQKPAETPVLPARSASLQFEPRRPIFRWKIRTGSDPTADTVKESPVRTTVEQLAAENRPADMNNPKQVYPAYQNRRASPVEQTIFEVEADIVAHKMHLSGSYHLDLRGTTGQTMIANCIDPRLAAGSRWEKEICDVRKKVEEKLRPLPTISRGNWRVRISGIGFFNQVHGQSGVAPNGLELTPVLSIEWLA